jgi:hypothetical protein
MMKQMKSRSKKGGGGFNPNMFRWGFINPLFLWIFYLFLRRLFPILVFHLTLIR